jgi:CheY-like chemotaxis protein
VYSGRLLILEDDPIVGKIIQMIATKSGLDARLVAHAHEFFNAIEEWQPTHIALDLVMPEMDGAQVLIELSKRNSSAKIIITSGMGPLELDMARRSANEHGLNVIGVLAKPFSVAALRAHLQEPAATT